MTDQPDRFAAGREERPEQTGPPIDEETDQLGADDLEEGDEADRLQSIASLEKLRDRVEVAAREMKRLRDENGALAERIQELESRPAVDPHGTVLSLDHDPDVLKRKISGFIDAIDQYLEKERQKP